MKTERDDLMDLVDALSKMVLKWRTQAEALKDLKQYKDIQTMILQNRRNADEIEILVGKVVSK